MEGLHVIRTFDGTALTIAAVAGALPILDADGTRIGAVGISGDTSDNDEAAAIAGIEAAGLTAAG